MNPDREGIEPDDFKARINGTRAAILEAATPRPASLAEVARELGEPLMKVSYHARVLRELGVLQVAGERRRGDGVERFYLAVEGAAAEGE